MISEVLAFLDSHEGKDQATGVGEFLHTYFLSPRFGCKGRRQGGGTFLVSLGTLSMAGSNVPEAAYCE